MPETIKDKLGRLADPDKPHAIGEHWAAHDEALDEIERLEAARTMDKAERFINAEAEIDQLTARLAAHDAAWDAAKEAIEILRDSPSGRYDTEVWNMCLQQIEWKRPGAEE